MECCWGSSKLRPEPETASAGPWALEGCSLAAPQLCLFPQCDESGGQQDVAASSLLGHTQNAAQNPRVPGQCLSWPLPQVHPPQGRPPCRGAPSAFGVGRGSGQKEVWLCEAMAAQGQAGVAREPALPTSPRSGAELRTQT